MKKGFTLAELLIVLGLIGIVAASTIPTLMSNVMNKVFTQSATITMIKIKEATAQMKVQGVLDGYTTNDAFVDVFQKYIKVSKRCASTELAKCFPASIKTVDGKKVDATAITTGTKLGNKNIGDNTVGLVLANGTSMLFTLRDDVKLKAADATDISCNRMDPFDNTLDTTKCMSFLYDTNGFGSPNTIGKDIVPINATLDTFSCTNYSGLCISDAITTYSANGTYTNSDMVTSGPNYWQGAVDICAAQGARLPTRQEMNTLKANMGALGITTADIYWGSDNSGDWVNYRYFVNNNNGGTYRFAQLGGGVSYGARCVR